MYWPQFGLEATSAVSHAKLSEAMMLIDPVPLGVSGAVTVPLAEFVACGDPDPWPVGGVLLRDEDRLAYVSQRLAAALQHPLTMAGSEVVAARVLEQFGDVDLFKPFSEKVLETLMDGERHDRMAISVEAPRVAAWFVSWSGSHQEVWSERYGDYLEMLASSARRVVDMGIELAGFLQIDAYVRENCDPATPCLPLEDVFRIDVELSYVPGLLVGFPVDTPNPLPNMFLVNRDLCSPEERQVLDRLST